MHQPIPPISIGPTNDVSSPSQAHDQNMVQINIPRPPDNRSPKIDNHETLPKLDKASASSAFPPTQLSQYNNSSQTPIQLAKQYRKTQKMSKIAHLPFTGPYTIDSFRIFSSSLIGGGATSRVEEQLARIARLRLNQPIPADDFDETPAWYNPSDLSVPYDGDAEWRQVRPEDKELRRYLVSLGVWWRLQH